MFDGETADSLALANTAILLRLLDHLIERGVIAKSDANLVLRDAMRSLEDCPQSGTRVEDAIRIIRKELMPSLQAIRPG